MDLITQALLGATIAEAGWRKDLGKKAIICGALFGLIPDFDVISAIGGQWSSMVHHRGITHSIVFAPVVAPLLGTLAWRWAERRGDVKQWVHMAFWVLLTHPLLDVFTPYGTQLLTPISDERFAFDGVSIIDPVYTVPLIIALIFAYFTRKTPNKGRRLSQFALVFTTLYLGFGYIQADRAKTFATKELQAQNITNVEKVRAVPTFINVWLWRVMAKQDTGDIHLGFHSHLHPAPIQFTHVKKPVGSRALDNALEDEHAKLFDWFAMGWVGYRIKETKNQTLIHMDDMRYGEIRNPQNSYWGVQATMDKDAKLVDINRVRYPRRNIGEEVRALWGKLWYGGSYGNSKQKPK